LALSTIRPNGGFAEPIHVTPTIAKFKYSIRLVIVQESCEERLKHPKKTWVDIVKGFSAWYTDYQQSTFGLLESLQHRGSAIAYSTMSMPKIWWMDRINFRTLLYEGKEICIDLMPQVLHNIETDLLKMWKEDILLGLPLNVSYDK
jgi:hypothetical protein